MGGQTKNNALQLAGVDKQEQRQNPKERE